MTRTARRCIALLGLMVLLFANAVVAGHACPTGASAMAAAQAADMPADCPDRDAGTPNACKAHCTSGQQQSGSAAFEMPPAPLAHVDAVAPFSLATIAANTWLPDAARSPAPATDPPVAIRNCCFRL